MPAIVQRLEQHFLRFRHQILLRVRGEALMLGLGASVGLATGLLAAAVIMVIRIVRRTAWGT